MKIVDTILGIVMNLIISFVAYCLADRILHGIDANSMLLYGMKATLVQAQGGVTIQTGWNVHPILSTAGFVFIIVFGLLTKWDSHYYADMEEVKQTFDIASAMGDIMDMMNKDDDDDDELEGDADQRFITAHEMDDPRQNELDEAAGRKVPHWVKEKDNV